MHLKMAHGEQEGRFERLLTETEKKYEMKRAIAHDTVSKVIQYRYLPYLPTGIEGDG